MQIPEWLAAVLAAAFVTQLFASILWGIRADKDGALRSQKLDEIVSLIKEHPPAQLRSDIAVLRRDHDELRDDYRGHHSLIRALGTRMDRARVPDTHPPSEDDQ